MYKAHNSPISFYEVGVFFMMSIIKRMVLV